MRKLTTILAGLLALLTAAQPGMAAFDADPHLRLLVIRGHAHGAALDAWVHELRTRASAT